MKRHSYKRSFRRRRQRTGFAVFVSLITLILVGILFLGLEPSSRTAGVNKIQRLSVPEVSGPPKAVADLESRDADVAAREATAKEPIPVPDIPYNATEREARDMLESKGLKLGEVKKEANDEYDEGGVFWQDPLPAVEVKQGSSVGITLSSGPKKEVEDKTANQAPKPDTNDLYLTVPKLGLFDNNVANTEDPVALDNGATKLPSTAFPWQDNGNTYVTAHRIGYEGTQSYKQFYNLPSMQQGDEVMLSDANGTTYTYEVTKVFAVMPQDNWVTYPVVGRDMVTLQTCIATVNDWWTITPGLLTSPPGPETARLIVQADRVDTQPS